MPRPRVFQPGLAGALLVALLLTPMGAALAQAQQPTVPVAGLIVRLKDAAALPDLQRSRALAARENDRWSAALARQSLAQGARMAPVGRDQRRLDWGRPLSPAEARELAARLARDPAVDWVDLDTRERRLSVPSDPDFAPYQWWLQPAGGTSANAIADRRRGSPGFQTAWASGLPGAYGDPRIVVAVLDTGITPHPELVGRLVPGYDFVADAVAAADGDGRDGEPTDPGDGLEAADLANPRFAGCSAGPSSWHGTIVAGMLAARTDDGVAVAAMLWQGLVQPVRIAGKCGATVSDIVDAMRWAAGLPVAGVPANPTPARVINISFGSELACGPAYQQAIDEVTAAGALVVAAAGNTAGAPTRPARCSGVVGVVALNRDGFKTGYSSFGPELSTHGLATVGGDDVGGTWGPLLTDGGLLTVWNDGRQRPGTATWAFQFGSSFAAPLVSGAAALMLSVNPALTLEQLRRGLGASARPHVGSSLMPACSGAAPGRCICSTATCGRGILDVPQALVFATMPAGYVAPAWPAANVDSREVSEAVALGPDRPPAAPPAGGSGGGGAPAPAALVGLALLAIASARGRRRRGR